VVVVVVVMEVVELESELEVVMMAGDG